MQQWNKIILLFLSFWSNCKVFMFSEVFVKKKKMASIFGRLYFLFFLKMWNILFDLLQSIFILSEFFVKKKKKASIFRKLFFFFFFSKMWRKVFLYFRIFGGKKKKKASVFGKLFFFSKMWSKVFLYLHKPGNLVMGSRWLCTKNLYANFRPWLRDIQMSRNKFSWFIEF